jgi:hypothetical protein
MTSGVGGVPGVTAEAFPPKPPPERQCGLPVHIEPRPNCPCCCAAEGQCCGHGLLPQCHASNLVSRRTEPPRPPPRTSSLGDARPHIARSSHLLPQQPVGYAWQPNGSTREVAKEHSLKIDAIVCPPRDRKKKCQSADTGRAVGLGVLPRSAASHRVFVAEPSDWPSQSCAGHLALRV